MKYLKVWIVLVGLTLFGYFANDNTFGGYLIWSLVIVAIIKCLLVGFQFMELKHAHRFWKVLFVCLVGVFFFGGMLFLR